MRIFVAGGTGVIGTRALRALVAAGHSVTAAARSDDKAELVRHLGGDPVRLDLFDGVAVTGATAGHDAIVNLATSIPPLTRAARPSAWSTNDRLRSEASANLVDAALAAGASRYVQESITLPYQDAGDRWIDEDDPCDHIGPFAAAAAAEASAARFTASGGTGIVLRFAQFYAPDSQHVRTFNTMVRRRLNPFVGDPASFVSFVHAEDAAAAVVAAFEAPAGTYNVVDDQPVTRAEAGRIVAEALDVKPPFAAPKLLRAASPSSAKLLMRSQRVSHARFTDATGWRASHPSIRGSWPAQTAPRAAT